MTHVMYRTIGCTVRADRIIGIRRPADGCARHGGGRAGPGQRHVTPFSDLM
jgi:hypothetical protein